MLFLLCVLANATPLPDLARQYFLTLPDKRGLRSANSRHLGSDLSSRGCRLSTPRSSGVSCGDLLSSLRRWSRSR